MKKDIYVIFLFIIMTLMSCGCGRVNGHILDTASVAAGEERSFEQVIRDIRTPEQLSEWMKRNINYREDQWYESDFRNPKDTFNLGYGDCDDFALFAKYWCDYHEIDAIVVSLYGDGGYAHAICIIHDAFFSNADLMYCSTAPIGNVFNRLCPSWYGFSLYPENLMQKVDRILYDIIWNITDCRFDLIRRGE